ncbi:MAG: type III pantothenate kinase [Pirellulales bacterium]|nr:type III pantothenate kinase [Pirellulales bacterium]
MVSNPFVAADVGNARVKLGLFEGSGPEPLRTLPLTLEKGDNPHLPERPAGCCAQMGTIPFFQFDRITPWLADVAEGSMSWPIASVNRPAATLLIEWLRAHRPADRVMLLAAADLPLQVRLPRPDMVGIDRLVDAVAVNRLRHPGQPAVIVDIGSAITVDLVSAEGVFLGGSILPGIEMSARALHHFTDLLPLVDVSDLGPPPPPLGTDTESAIQSGLYWGAVGAIDRLVEQFNKAASGGSTAASTQGGQRPQIFLTGGAGAAAADLLGYDACYIPNLTLTGIALSFRQSASGRR